jgi:acetyl esterase/lipase
MEMIKTLLTLFGLVLFVGGLTYHFARLQLFNALVPKDPESIQWQSEMAYGTDPRQTLQIYMPREAVADLPVVVFVHGGSWETGDKSSYDFVGRALAAQGFMTLVINYRLHPKHQYPAFVEDVALALRWTADNVKSMGGNPDMIFVMGHSAGAYNIAMAVLDKRYDQKRPKLAGVITLAGPFDFVPLDSPITIKVFGGLPNLPDTQPVNHARPDAPPFLILHGSADETVFPRNAVALDKALRDAGAQSTLKMYDGVNHANIMLALSTWMRGQAPTLKDAVAFMKAR